MRELTYQPKGGMCAGCVRAHMDCSHLPFSDMPPICKPDAQGVVVVRCTHYENRKAEFLDQMFLRARLMG